MTIKELVDISIRFINLNYLIILIFTSVIYLVLFILMIAKLKKLCLFEFSLFIVSLILIGIHFVSDYLGYSFHILNNPNLTLILFATIFYGLSAIISLIVLIIRLIKSPKTKVINKVSDNKENIKNENNSFINYLSKIEEAIGFYDEAIDSYYLTKKMQNALGLEANIISKNDFRNLIISSDKVVLHEMEKNNKGIFRYQIKTKNGTFEIEEKKDFNGTNSLSTLAIIKSDAPKFVIGDRRHLENDLTNLIVGGKEFGLIFVLINNGQVLINNLGRIDTFRVISEYFKMIKKDLFSSFCNIYEIGPKEYCILTDNIDLFIDNLNMVKDNNSNLLEASINYKEEEYIVTNVLGFVNSNEVEEKNAIEYIEAGRLSLFLADKKGFNFMEYKINKLNDEEKEFESLKVDISNNFLDEL